MKTKLLIFILCAFFAGFATAKDTQAAENPSLDEYEIRVKDIHAVFARLKAQAKDETFAVFVFTPGPEPFDPKKEAINIQFYFEDGRIGLDWVLLGPQNIQDQEKYKRLAKSLGYKVFAKEKNRVRYLRTEEGDLPRLCERAIIDLYSLRQDSKIGLLIHGMRWP